MNSFAKITDNDIEYTCAHLPQLVFEVTDACNLRCKYCGYAELYEGYDQRENFKLPFHKAKLIIDYLHSIWEKYYCKGVCNPMNIGFYGGEPLLNMLFIRKVMEYVESLPQVGKKFYYSMTTNAMLLDKYMDFLADKKVRLLISLDGDKEGQGYRVDAWGRNSFDQVYTNINLIREKHPEYFEKFVMFNSVLHSKNSVDSIYHFIKNTFGKEPSISPLNNSGIRKDKINEFNNTYRNYKESIEQTCDCETLKKEIFIKNPETNSLLNYIYYNSGNVFFDYNDLLLPKSKRILPPTGTCIPFSKKMFITVKGRILQCERINHEFTLGQITDTAVNLDLKQIAMLYNSWVYKYAKQCKNCANKMTCLQCVYQIDDINNPETKCLNFCTPAQKDIANEHCLEYLSKHPELYSKLLKNVVIRG